MFLDEIKKSLESYQIEDIDEPPQEMIITGSAGDVIDDLVSLLNESLHIPTRVEPYLTALGPSDAIKVGLTTKNRSFLNVIAPLLVSEKVKVNLIPEEVKIRRAFEVRSREVIKMGIYAMTVFLLICSIFFGEIYFKTAHLNYLVSKYTNIHEQANRLGQQHARVRAIEGHLAERGLSLEILTHLHRIMPDGIYLLSIKYEDRTGFSIKGTAHSMSDVFLAVDEMENSDLYKNVKTKYATKRREGDIDVTDFEINGLTETHD